MIRPALLVLSLSLIACAASARDLAQTLADPPLQTWQTTNGADLKFCVVTSVAAKTGQASTVIDRGKDTYVIVHNWSSPVPGDDVRGVFIIKPTGVIEFRGQKQELVSLVERCNNL